MPKILYIDVGIELDGFPYAQGQLVFFEDDSIIEYLTVNLLAHEYEGNGVIVFHSENVRV